MPRPKAHYSLVLKNHYTGEQLRLDLIDLPFATAKRFRLRLNGRWAKKLPVASKTAVLRQLRGWWVGHWNGAKPDGRTLGRVLAQVDQSAERGRVGSA